MTTTSREAVTVSLGNVGLISSDEGGAATSTDKENSSQLGAQGLQFHQGLLGSIPTLQPSGFHSFIVNALILAVNTLQVWEFNLCCNSAPHRITLCVWFSVISALWLQKIRSLSGQT